MTFLEIVDLVVTIMLLVLMVMAGLLISNARTLVSSLEQTLRRLQHEITHLVDEVSELVEDAGEDVNKFETLLDAANTVTSSMGSASKLAYSAVVSPVVKAKAMRAGVVKLVKVFRSQPATPKGGRR